MSDHGDDIPEPGPRSRLSDLADQTVYKTGKAAPPAPEPKPEPEQVDALASARREFAILLGEFRRTAVLVPFDPHGSLWTADQNGVRWICAFSNEEALARFAEAQGDSNREWTYRTILGARLLDAMVPVLPGPAGVALDAGSANGVLFPPVAGIVPDHVAVDPGETG
ncbi:SseB family protein [Streptomyces californicus]|uniref:SseB family protein n=1 Tax=Streptomyces californicus TaxID=67351 RepID=UPI0036860F26